MKAWAMRGGTPQRVVLAERPQPTPVLEGKVVHWDNHGGSGVLGPGDAQWMTAGRGPSIAKNPGMPYAPALDKPTLSFEDDGAAVSQSTFR